jgi:predicted phosphate transport protein (TIGR00153 family)
MRTIARLFGKSPFAPLQTHMNKVGSCVEKLTRIFEVLPKMEMETIERLAMELSSLEHEADLTKNDIRNTLPTSIFMPIDRGHFLEILSIQDTIADKAEEIGFLLTLRPLERFDDFKEQLAILFKKNATVFWSAKQIIEEIDDLLESSFGGIEAEKVKSMVEQTAFKEHEANRMKHTLLKQLFTSGENLSTPSFFLWQRLIEEISTLAKLSEKLANRIRMVLELK